MRIPSGLKNIFLTTSAIGMVKISTLLRFQWIGCGVNRWQVYISEHYLMKISFMHENGGASDLA